MEMALGFHTDTAQGLYSVFAFSWRGGQYLTFSLLHSGFLSPSLPCSRDGARAGNRERQGPTLKGLTHLQQE